MRLGTLVTGVGGQTHPPVHLAADAIRREGQGEIASVDPLFRRAGIDLDW
jgi:hypothetical protein